jgi:hypothetical protein
MQEFTTGTVLSLASFQSVDKSQIMSIINMLDRVHVQSHRCGGKRLSERLHLLNKHALEFLC